MRNSNLDIVISGENPTNTNEIKVNLLEYLSFIKLPLTIVEKRNSKHTKVSYKEQEFHFFESTKDEEMQKLFVFLLKVNPQTGKVCKCSDCKNCPSKKRANLENKLD